MKTDGPDSRRDAMPRVSATPRHPCPPPPGAVRRLCRAFRIPLQQSRRKLRKTDRYGWQPCRKISGDFPRLWISCRSLRRVFHGRGFYAGASNALAPAGDFVSEAPTRLLRLEISCRRLRHACSGWRFHAEGSDALAPAGDFVSEAPTRLLRPEISCRSLRRTCSGRRFCAGAYGRISARAENFIPAGARDNKGRRRHIGHRPDKYFAPELHLRIFFA
jgi:hypothetical protein